MTQEQKELALEKLNLVLEDMQMLREGQTAVEWLQECLNLHLTFEQKMSFEGLFQQAKEMEKEQIINSFVECWKENMPEGYECKQSAEYYYNETYNTNEK